MVCQHIFNQQIFEKQNKPKKKKKKEQSLAFADFQTANNTTVAHIKVSM